MAVVLWRYLNFLFYFFGCLGDNPIGWLCYLLSLLPVLSACCCPCSSESICWQLAGDKLLWPGTVWEGLSGAPLVAPCRVLGVSASVHRYQTPKQSISLCRPCSGLPVQAFVPTAGFLSAFTKLTSPPPPTRTQLVSTGPLFRPLFCDQQFEEARSTRGATASPDNGGKVLVQQ